jgi:hypothetical protein
MTKQLVMAALVAVGLLAGCGTVRHDATTATTVAAVDYGREYASIVDPLDDQAVRTIRSWSADTDHPADPAGVVAVMAVDAEPLAQAYRFADVALASQTWPDLIQDQVRGMLADNRTVTVDIENLNGQTVGTLDAWARQVDSDLTKAHRDDIAIRNQLGVAQRQPPPA